MSETEGKGIETNETDCDNPISLDEIEKGLWLGMFSHSFINHDLWINQRGFSFHTFFRRLHSSSWHRYTEETEHYTHFDTRYLPFTSSHYRASILKNQIYSWYRFFQAHFHLEFDIWLDFAHVWNIHCSFRYPKRWFVVPFRRVH